MKPFILKKLEPSSVEGNYLFLCCLLWPDTHAYRLQKNAVSMHQVL